MEMHRLQLSGSVRNHRSAHTHTHTLKKTVLVGLLSVIPNTQNSTGAAAAACIH